MKRSITLSILASAIVCTFLVAQRESQAAPMINVYPSVAPNATSGSPSWVPYQTNAMFALTSGASSAGIPNTPGYYSQVPNGGALPVGAYIVTNFNSWLGNANPMAAFGAAYGGEYGNRVHYGVHVVSDSQFSISQMSFNLTYDDANTSNYSVFSVASYNYSSAYVGLNYGPDGVKGGGDDVLITSGVNTQLVNEVFGRGSGLGYEVLTSFPPSGGTNQDKIDLFIQTYFSDPHTFTGTYTIDGVSGSAFVRFNEVPEPASLAIWGLLSLAGVGVFRRRRRTAALNANA
jgi:MYXO-CTERM domain-containing protein